MKSPPYSGRHSGRATPSLRATPNTAHHDGNRQRLHLSRAETCPDEAGQLYHGHVRNEPPAIGR